MTRETKIGLLVGLAFIIVIGILFADYRTSTTEPALASLQGAGTSVRSGLGQPASKNAPPVMVVPPTNVVPSQTVPTREELNPHRPAPLPVAGQTTPSGSVTPAGSLTDAAKRAGEQLVDVNGRPVNGDDTFPPAPRTPVSYTAVSGDSLTKIAAKVYGTSTRDNRRAIAEANPSLRENPNRIKVGQTYVIPPLNGATAILPTPTPVVVVDKSGTDAKYVYIVKPHDTLWSIAQTELGDTNTIAAIKELNKDVLRGSDRVRPNMKLRLPAKPVTT